MQGRGKQRNRQQSGRRHSRNLLIKKLDQIERESRQRGVPGLLIIRIVDGQYQVFEGIPRGLIDLPLD